MAAAYELELEAALEASHRASEYLRMAYRQFDAIEDAPANITTDADRRSQELILAHLTDRFPFDAVCAEEATASLQKIAREGTRLWVIDPIDGTRGFARKNGEFSVMIGLVVDGRVVLGVVEEPVIDRVTFARRHHGCWSRRGQDPLNRCHVTDTKYLSDSILVQSHSIPGKPSTPVALIGPKQVVETYSAGVKMAMVARGEVDLYVNTYSKFSDWDICAGDILITEAGGLATELSGKPLQYGRPGNAQTGGLLASNLLLASPALERLSRM